MPCEPHAFKLWKKTGSVTKKHRTEKCHWPNKHTSNSKDQIFICFILSTPHRPDYTAFTAIFCFKIKIKHQYT